MPPKYHFEASDLIKRGIVEEQVLKNLKEWCSKQTLPLLTEEQLIIFLLSVDNVCEYAQKVIEKFFKYRAESPQIFYNMNIKNEDLVHGTKMFNIALMPKRTANNEAITWGNVKDTSYHNFHLVELLKISCMLLDSMPYKDPPNGFICVMDMKGVGFLHLTRLRFGLLQVFMKYVQEAIPCKIKEIHILNSVPVIYKILFLLKPLMSKELYEALNFHPPGKDWDEISENLPKNCRPKDYGGNLAELDDLANNTNRDLEQLTELFSDLEEQARWYEENCK